MYKSKAYFIFQDTTILNVNFKCQRSNNLVRSFKGKSRSNVLFSLFRFLGVTNVNIKQIENQMKFAQKAKKLVPAKAIFFTDY